MNFSKFLIVVLPFLCVTSCQLNGGSTDITVVSDLEEKSVVKEATVKKKVFDKNKALTAAKTLASGWQKSFTKDKCSNRKYSEVKEMCFKTYKENTIPAEKLVSDIGDMPELLIVRYRRIFTDVNGDRSASNYEQVACIPSGTKEEIDTWIDIVTSDANSLLTNRSKQEQDLKSHLQLVADAVCVKYGGLDDLDKIPTAVSN